jgi:hypothetical protein
MKTHASLVGAAIVLVAAATVPALAESVDASRPAAADARIAFSGVTGDIEIVGHDGGTMELTGTLGDDVERLRIDGDERSWTVELEMKENGGGWRRGDSASDLVLRVPAGADVDAEFVSADLALRDLAGSSVQVETVSGDVMLASVSPRELRVHTVSGRVDADGGGSELNRFESVSGSVTVAGSRGRVETESVSGNVELDAADVSDLRVETVSGHIDARVRPAERARLSVTSHSGNIDLYLPAGSSLRIEAETFSGRIDSAFGGEVESGFGPGESLTLDNGSDAVAVEATTFSGSLRLRELD